MLRARTQQHGTEFAALVEAGTGTQVGTVLQGAEREVDISSHLEVLRPRRRYVHLHTHPRSTAFSDADAVILVSHPGLRTMTVTGRDGTWYLLSKVPGQRPASVTRVVDAFETRLNALRPKYRALVQSGAVGGTEAWRQLLHEVWETIAPQLGLR